MPTILKEATVIPIYKRGTESAPKNDRPLYLTYISHNENVSACNMQQPNK